MDAAELTARRTAAASALAARYLARKDASKLLVVGTGKLSPYLAEAHSAGREMQQVSIWGRDPEKASQVVERLAEVGLKAEVATDLEAAARDADIVSCVTTTKTPLVKGAWLKEGAHLDLVGAFRSDMRECDDEAVRRASLYVDTFASALIEGGDLTQPLESGVISREDVLAELSDLTNGRSKGRKDDNEITLFKSVGASIEDYAGAELAWRQLNA